MRPGYAHIAGEYVQRASRLREIKRRLKAVIAPAPAATQVMSPHPFASSLSEREQVVVAEAQPHSITGPERLVGNMDAVRYVVERDVPGAFVECGVWRGGSVLVMIRTLQDLGVDDRDFYLYDTFEQMTAPSGADTSKFNEAAIETWEAAQAEGRTPWDVYFRPDLFSLEGVKDLMRDTGYPVDRIHFAVGRVEDTLPSQAPDRIALLRLDTDWYESTKHELEHLYPLVSDGGVLIVDDYGHWDGCRRAVDEYFSDGSRRPLFGRVDYAARMAVKH